MKKEKLSTVYVCPTTDKPVPKRGVIASLGVCPSCGCLSGREHFSVISGFWLKPSWLMTRLGSKPKFIAVDSS